MRATIEKIRSKWKILLSLLGALLLLAVIIGAVVIDSGGEEKGVETTPEREMNGGETSVEEPSEGAVNETETESESGTEAESEPEPEREAETESGEEAPVDVPPQQGESTSPVVYEDSGTDPGEWNLLLVNPWNEIPDAFTVELTWMNNGHAVDARAYPELREMMDAMRAEGLSPLICSSYRSNETQQRLYSNRVKRCLDQGYSQEEAETEAAKWVALPGTSEHQLGLAVDIVDESYQLLDKGQEDNAVQKWLMENSWEYGYILRYPTDKSDITGINYEPWHYRYVGKTAAKEIYEQGVCLEEYLDMLLNISEQ